MPMHSDSTDNRDREQRALAIGQQIAALLDDLERIAPGSVNANIVGLGFRIKRRGSSFTAERER
jgi:hypothetical protein